LIVEHFLPQISLPQVQVADSREALARMAAAFYGNPADGMSIVGITGTNGKTTTTYLLKAIFEAAGEKVGLMGTIATMVGDEVLPQSLTTPDPMEFHSALRRMADAGCRRVVMEVSAHALALRKMAGVVFDVAIFSNLTQDHLDDFKTMENYRQAKALLFADGVTRAAVLNADDQGSALVAGGFHGPRLWYGLQEGADLRATQVDARTDGVSFTMNYQGRTLPVALGLSGHFNVSNALSAAGAALLLGVDIDTVIAGLNSVQRMNGRMERVENNRGFTVLVDYAHSEDSLENLLKAAKVFTKNRIIVVFGCGGDRDRTKRPHMGRIATSMADLSILTSDNPRTEDPRAIVEAIEGGAREGGKPYLKIVDREAAIEAAIKAARPGDVVLIAGKGHETYQDAMGVKRHFDDREVARKVLDRL
jgi:UDP-N-acetylmuramoyl-L-alanyl-D-glutamate--2,6-diaminopimelate ligase